jgi:hypothetical protein
MGSGPWPTRGCTARTTGTSPPYHGALGWVSLDLTAAPVDWAEVRELLDASYRQVALERMLALLPDTRSERD